MIYNTIHSLGSRCLNSDILKHYGYREFSGFFDFMNTQKVETIIHILENDFKELLDSKNNITLTCNQLTFDPETGEPLPSSKRTTNKFYALDPTDIHEAIFPHHDLNSDKDYSHFINCRKRLKKLTNFNTLFIYTFNTWENPVNQSKMESIVKALEDVHYLDTFKICFIGLSISLGLGSQTYRKELESEKYDVWQLTVPQGSFTGGLFKSPLDNENFINIITSYNIDSNRVTKEQIDKLECPLK